MSMSAKPPRLGGPVWLLWAGWAWALLLLFGIVFISYKMPRPRGALDLGEHMFGYVLFFVLPLLILTFVTAISWLVMGVHRLYKKDPDLRVPWIRLAALTVVILAVNLKSRPPILNPITPDSESVYLALASAAREQFAGETLKRISLDPDPDRFSKGDFPDSVAKRFDQMIPHYWPRYLLSIWADDRCVVLGRGSGMLGMVGVRIYDKGPVILYSDEELRTNPYLPRQTRITDRLWFFTSD